MVESSPLKWPLAKKRTPVAERKRAHFGSKKEGRNYATGLSIAEAVKRLMREIRAYTGQGQSWRIYPEDVVISSNLKYRVDGFPYSNQKPPEDCGVAVYFTLDGRDYCLPCDKWDRIADNIAAVAAHISAMRGIERWGVGESKDAFAGFKALPEVTEADGDIWKILKLPAKPSTRAELDAAYKQKAKIDHPDVPGGSATAFAELNNAYRKALQLLN